MSQDTAQKRLQSIDLLRGLAIVLMALDHTRDFFGASGPNPRDITDPAVFLTRWVTHFCAPTFIFLAGVSAYLYGSRKRSVGQLSWFLLTRGLWLVFIEFTLVRFGWTLTFDLKLFFAGVIWVIGASMIVLAGLVYLPERAIAAIALIMIAGHNLLDGVRAERFGNLGWLWNFLHQPALLHIGAQSKFLVVYTLVPWAGVMAMGYALGPVFKLDPGSRRHLLLWAGTALIAGFILLRATNLYGDPAPWSVQNSSLATLLSFINCEKYPPSLLYLMMTLGPALVLLALFETCPWPDCRLAHDLWPRTLSLLCGAPPRHPCPCCRACLANCGRCRLYVRRSCPAETAGLWARSSRYLRPMALDTSDALSALPSVCRAQAGPAGLVVELSLKRSTFGPVLPLPNLTSRRW